MFANENYLDESQDKNNYIVYQKKKNLSEFKEATKIHPNELKGK